MLSTAKIFDCFVTCGCFLLFQVGLAVDNIRGVQENAVLERLAMQVNLVLDVEKLLPDFLRTGQV